MLKHHQETAGGGPEPREIDRPLSEEQQPAKTPGGEPTLSEPESDPGPRRIPTELEMAEGLAAEAAGELPELREDEAEANPRARFLLTDVDMLCNYCEESPCASRSAGTARSPSTAARAASVLTGGRIEASAERPRSA